MGATGHGSHSHSGGAALRPHTIQVAIPACGERDWLPKTLDALANQDDSDFEVWVCVNQAAEKHEDPSSAALCADNRETLDWLQRQAQQFPFRLHVLDRALPEKAPPASVAGVGWARRLLFDTILERVPTTEVCVSLDADTLLPNNYLSSVRTAFSRYSNATALAAPYYHHLPRDPDHARRLLRYEIYLRYYQLALWWAGSPYAFLALGSAMAFRARAYVPAGGMPPRSAGEDFYFMQRLRKHGPVIRWIESKVYPSARVSQRVPFGTGPLMAQADLTLLERRFPFYDPGSFALLKGTFQQFPQLFVTDTALPMETYWDRHLGGLAVFERLRRNFKSQAHFIRACHDKLDGLRTLQFLKFKERETKAPPDAAWRVSTLLAHLGEAPVQLDFENQPLDELNRVRDRLAAVEARLQRAFMDQWDQGSKW